MKTYVIGTQYESDWTIEILLYEEDELCHFEEFHLFGTEINAEVAFLRLKDKAERDIFASLDNPSQLISLYRGKSPEGKPSRSAIIEKKKEEKKKEKISRLEDEICWLKNLLFSLQEEKAR